MKKKITSGYPLILNYLGIFAILIGIINLLPLILLVFKPGEAQHATGFLVSGFGAIAVGLFVLFLFKGREKGNLKRYQDTVLVVSIWILAILISSLPFLVNGNYNFTQSVFEATSGYSTTGLTVVDVNTTPYVFLFFRSLLQFFGGVGLVLVLTSAISDKFGMRLYNAEGHSDKLMPNLIKSARMILSIYMGYIIIGSILYVIFGMSVFDAVNHSITAVATGGFSTREASIGHYNSVGIEIVTMLLMILGGTNFFIHLLLLRGKFRNVFRHIELKFLGILLLIFIPLMTMRMMSVYNGNIFHSLRIASFQFISAITGTGFQTINSFMFLPSFFILALIIPMIIGAGMGSTAGGMKQYRVALAFKTMYWNIKDQLTHKKTIRTHFINRLGTKTIVEKEAIIQNYSFLMIYIVVLVVGTVIFSRFGYSISSSLFEFSSALGTVGLSVGITGFNAHPVILWTAIVGMFLGRLEFYVVFIAISKITIDITKKKNNNGKSKVESTSKTL